MDKQIYSLTKNELIKTLEYILKNYKDLDIKPILDQIKKEKNLRNTINQLNFYEKNKLNENFRNERYLRTKLYKLQNKS